MYKVMFVCMGNVCRSPLAHILLGNYLQNHGLTDKISVESSGVNVFSEGQAMCENIVSTAAGRGLSMKHYSRRFYKEDGEDFNLILAMDNNTMTRIKDHLKGTNPIGEVRYFRFFDPVKSGGNEVPDPWYGGNDESEMVYDMIERTMKPLVDSIINKENTDE
jgi:low molecular weight protein-tyrosine phosphatase